jgi:hypothetical protein
MNLVEGEGLGTAYEYHVKLRKLQRFINSMDRPRRILIAGLPERYGLSMDFLLIGQLLGAETLVVDDRREVLERAQRIFEILRMKEYFHAGRVAFSGLSSISELRSQQLMGGGFDLALSSEVLQRLGGEIGPYLSQLADLAKSYALFAPNQDNRSHAKVSGLRGVSLEELIGHCSRVNSGVQIYERGYIDMPPFPPGLSRSQETRERASRSRFEAIVMRGLEIAGRCENFWPTMIKRKRAHIVYVLGKTI